MLEVEGHASSVRFLVRVKPRASRSRILAVLEGALEVAIAAPPVEGAANTELIRLLAATLERGKSTIVIVSGEGSRSKLISIAGLTPAELVARLKQGLSFVKGMVSEASAGTDSGNPRRD